MSPEELIQELGPGTDGAVCVQRLIDNQAVPNPTKHAGLAPKVEHEADTKDDDEKDEKDEKAPHTPYRNPKRG